MPGGRDSNQDRVHVEVFHANRNLWHIRGLLIVADGMGGHEDGAAASRIVVETVTEVLGATEADRDEFSETWAAPSLDELLRRTIRLANSRVYVRGVESDAGLSMGTTATVLALTNESCTIGHVGDTRAYRAGPDGIELLTQDHTFTAEAVREGKLSEEEALQSPFAGQLTRTVGTRDHVDPDLLSLDPEPGRAFLLCSDGLTGVLSDAEIEAHLCEASSPEEAVQALIGLAERNETNDNVSAAILDLGWFDTLRSSRRARGTAGFLSRIRSALRLSPTDRDA